MKARNRIAELAMLVVSIVVTVSLALALLRWLAPGLLGVSEDLVLVQSDKKVPPFYENIFREEHWSSPDYLLQDPIVKVRAKPMYPDFAEIGGPNDILGFRNMAVPISSEVIVIGDSQTYGNNAIMWENWPHALESMLPQGTSVYSFATGGWGALQYYAAFSKVALFTPKVVIVAYYTGNDPLETYSLAIASKLWKEFLPERDIANYGTPSFKFPAPESEQWPVEFADGIRTVFTPKLRHTSNMQHPAVDAGYEIMLNVAAAITKLANDRKIRVIFTVIPTKEYVYSEKIKLAGVDIDPNYRQLIIDEQKRILDFSSRLKNLNSIEYIDVANKLKEAALKPIPLYPDNIDGHPLATGYRVIASAIETAVGLYVEKIENGFYFSESEDGLRRSIYVEDGKFWFTNVTVTSINGKKTAVVATRRLASLQFAGHLSAVTHE